MVLSQSKLKIVTRMLHKVTFRSQWDKRMAWLSQIHIHLDKRMAWSTQNQYLDKRMAWYNHFMVVGMDIHLVDIIALGNSLGHLVDMLDILILGNSLGILRLGNSLEWKDTQVVDMADIRLLGLGNSLDLLDISGMDLGTCLDVVCTQDWTLVVHVVVYLGNCLGTLDTQVWTLGVTQVWTLVMLVKWDTVLVVMVTQVVDNVAKDVPGHVAVRQDRWSATTAGRRGISQPGVCPDQVW